MLHAVLGFSVGAGSVAILYETVLKKSSNSKKVFIQPSPAQKATTTTSSGSQQQQNDNNNNNNGGIDYNCFPSYIIPSTTEQIFAAPDNAFISDFSNVLKTPRWVLEVLDRERMKEVKSNPNKGDRNNSKFFSNESIDERFRASNADYNKPGLSRGHLACAQNHKGSQEEMNATFDLSLNCCPQDMTQNACDWLRLEQMTKTLAKDFSRLFVVTGPAFVPSNNTTSTTSTSSGKSSSSSSSLIKQMSYDVIGEHEVAVPTHMFKCLLGEDPKNSKNSAIGCFLMSNAPILQERPMTAFEVPIEQLERITGLSIFEEPRFNKVGGKSWYPLCSKHKCEGSYGSFSKSFRQIGMLRVAKTKQELDEQWNIIQKEHAATNTPVEGNIAKEYQNRLKNFV